MAFFLSLGGAGGQGMSAQIASQRDVPLEIVFLRDELLPVALASRQKYPAARLGFCTSNEKMKCGRRKNVMV